MIAKELRGARWATLATLAVLGLITLQLATINLRALTLKALQQQADAPVTAVARGQISLAGAYIWATLFADALYFVAGLGGALFGSRLVASEASSGSILLLLSRPVSRERALLTKYGVAAGLLLALACVSGVLALLFGALHGLALPPLGGLVASILLLWLAALFVCGVTLVYSVLIPNALAAGFLGFFTVYVLVIGPAIYNRVVNNAGGSDLSLGNYWGSLDIYVGAASPTQSLLIALAAAAVPLVIALALFRRKAF